jgi:hypothetical protein
MCLDRQKVASSQNTIFGCKTFVRRLQVLRDVITKCVANVFVFGYYMLQKLAFLILKRVFRTLCTVDRGKLDCWTVCLLYFLGVRTNAARTSVTGCLPHLGTDGRILRSILNKQDVREQSGLIWPRIRIRGGMRSALFCDITRRRVVIVYRRYRADVSVPSSWVKESDSYPRRMQIWSTSRRKPEIKRRDVSKAVLNFEVPSWNLPNILQTVTYIVRQRNAWIFLGLFNDPVSTAYVM